MGAKVKTHPLRSAAAATRIVKQLDNRAINVAFLDPFNLGDLHFNIIETFATLQKVELIVHVSAMDLIRQLPGAMKAKTSTIDNFAPGWRSAVAGLQPGEEARGKIIEHWLNLVRGLGFEDAVHWRLIRGQTSQPLYWLVLISKHPLAAKLWDKSFTDKQSDLFRPQ